MGNNGNKCVVVIVIVVAILILVIALVATSLKKLASDEVGVAYDTIQKNLGQQTKKEGLHTGPPGFEFIIFPSVYKSLDFDDLKCLNKDGVQIVLDVTYQYKARPQNLREIILDFRDFDGYVKVLKYAGQSALHESCSYFNTSQFQAERGAFQERVRTIIKERYNALHADITDLQLISTLRYSEGIVTEAETQLNDVLDINDAMLAYFDREPDNHILGTSSRFLLVSNIARPSEYESAIRSKERAREDIQVALNERPRLLTEAETTKRQAETQAEIIIDKANSDARILQNKAKAEAEAIVSQYQKEAEAYEKILSQQELGFTIEGFISYLGVRVIADAKNPVFIGLESPAKSSYKTP